MELRYSYQRHQSFVSFGVDPLTSDILEAFRNVFKTKLIIIVSELNDGIKSFILEQFSLISQSP